MTLFVPAARIAKATEEEKPALREALQEQAALLIAHQLRERVWLQAGVAGVVTLAGLVLWQIAHRAGAFDRFPSVSENLILGSQLCVVALFVIMATVYLLGRLRLVRSEIDLLRLKLEWLSSEVEPVVDESGSTASLLKGAYEAERRKINLEPRE